MRSRTSSGARLVAASLGALIVVSLAGCSTPSGGGGASPTGPVSPPPLSPSGSATSSPTTPSNSAAAAHCRDTGGTVQLRQPTFGTNNDASTWVELGNPIEVCRYQMGEGQTSTRIYADLVTLNSSKPTLAALAYLAKKPLPSQSSGANPASIGCTALGGTDQFGSSLNGGGLVDKSDADDPVFSPCTFADQSFIEEFGITYYADNVIRGKDLKTVFRFDQSNLPPVFTS